MSDKTDKLRSIDPGEGDPILIDQNPGHAGICGEVHAWMTDPFGQSQIPDAMRKVLDLVTRNRMKEGRR